MLVGLVQLPLRRVDLALFEVCVRLFERVVPGVEVIDGASLFAADLGLLEVSERLVEVFGGLLEVPHGTLRLRLGELLIELVQPPESPVDLSHAVVPLSVPEVRVPLGLDLCLLGLDRFLLGRRAARGQNRRRRDDECNDKNRIATTLFISQSPSDEPRMASAIQLPSQCREE